ncbi:hypothetical protein CBE01nite_34700 [Clostridium beijerinckii]|uniref:Uncharacterized protein n=1 Tax=Clostridium beijerinckii TaxID=1520 RepID=A0AB74VFC0_CLOBE|nr:hypothetical protein [Clostridium beijerinckii]NRZ24384.1 hypothetical protein [Clostridium beijerinckii]NYB99397.1 hypothetical protein [Clostridium beijerinckii]OOM21594.1 hypothetical protein CLBEI_37270 [Clostridium beijerinckii]QUN35217.1 hypothetical protein KEC93_25530 [Clostridium beijerinckii]SQB20297.1 Uncharacterised protein [Clostridium beijerinckii]
MIVKKIKKIAFSTLSVALLGCLFIPAPAQAEYYSASGLISRYNGEGKVGYDGKTLTSSDCATKQYVDNPPAGTEIYVNDDTNRKSYHFFKYDVGNFPSGVVLDLTYSGWAKFGHPSSLGHFQGRYYHN